MEWIDITKQLPPHTCKGVNDAIMLLVVVDIPCYGQTVEKSLWINNRFGDYPQGDSNVTHWMPIPELP